MEENDINIDLRYEGYRHPSDRLERMIVLIGLLKYKRRRNYKQLGDLLGKSDRQIRRDVKTLEKFFDLDIDEFGRPFIYTEKNEDGLFINVTEEELTVLLGLVRKSASKLRDGLIKKLDRNLYLNFEARDDLATMIDKIHLSVNKKSRLLIKGYQGAKDKQPKDVLVEPVQLVEFKYLHAYDVSDGRNKLYSLTRITGSVELTDELFAYDDFHQHTTPDIFGMITGKAFHVKLSLSNRAKLLLMEEFPRSVAYISSQGIEDFPWLFDAQLYGLEGVGRFVMGLPGEVKIMEGEELQLYVKEKIRGVG